MSAMEKYLNLAIEYQKAKENEHTIRATPVVRTPAIIAAEADRAFRAMIGTGDDTLARAYSASHNALQRLSFILEAKGVLDHKELAQVWNEDPDA
jgi:hypothetical protein